VQALTAVLEECSDRYPDVHIACLGDLVGYGGNPGEVIDTVKKAAKTGRIIGGNHDYGLVGMHEFSTEYFNSLAHRAILNHRSMIDSDQRSWLGRLPMFVEANDVLLCHGSPVHTNHYITARSDIESSLGHVRAYEKNVICHGHTHTPLFSRVQGGEIDMLYPFEKEQNEAVFAFDDADVVFVNPGSVGQPRDKNPDAAFAFIDLEQQKAVFHRMDYDVRGAQQAIAKAGHPGFLAERLAKGI
jgi:diadenosine tetraphosphatase ApaH/serine/threonine PP2A family protein phosphatase